MVYPSTMRNVRLLTGLVMLAYVSTHLLNHALGIFSLALAEAGLALAVRVWHSTPGTVALYGAFAVHFGLALRTLYQRRNWKLPVIEWIRLWSGFSLPLLLIGHAVSTRIAASFYGFDATYDRVVSSLLQAGAQGWQIALLAPGWVHGCLGLWIGLRHIPIMWRMRWPLAIAVAIVPALSATGFLVMSQEVSAPGRKMPVDTAKAASANAESLRHWREGLMAAYLAMLGTAFAAGRIRQRM